MTDTHQHLIVLAALVSTSCATAPPPTTRAAPFALSPPLWVDDDRTPTAKRPRPYFSPLLWDGADQAVMRPIARALAVEVRGESVDVNALDEVPDSSWFENRISRRPLSPREIEEGACKGTPPPDPNGRWLVVKGKAKSDGASLGFTLLGPDGNRYFAKLDEASKPEISTGADAVGSRLFWAAGYNTPCYYVLDIPRTSLALDPAAMYRNDVGHLEPYLRKNLEETLARTTLDGQGRYRVGLSRFLDGDIGPFTYEGLRHDDPNDRVRHEERRELRGAQIFSAWMNHWDARASNTLNVWVETGGGQGYLVHYLIDFSDTMGGFFPSQRISRRLGYSHYLDAGQLTADFFTLGAIDRPWETSTVNTGADIFGYFSAERFDPSAWKAAYPNPAYDRMTERDGAWAARILARFTFEDIDAAVRAARFSRPQYSRYLVETLAARRELILARYLTRRSPLADATLRGRSLCVRDLALAAGVYAVARFEARAAEGFPRAGALATSSDGAGSVCVELPPPAPRDPALAPGDASRYRVVELRVLPDGTRPPTPLRVSLYDLGDSWFLAGMEH